MEPNESDVVTPTATHPARSHGTTELTDASASNPGGVTREGDQICSRAQTLTRLSVTRRRICSIFKCHR